MDLSTSKSEALWTAAASGDLWTVQQLSDDPSVDLNLHHGPRGDTPLLVACRNGHLSTLEYLLYHEHVDLNAQNSWGASLLYLACQGGHAHLVPVILAHPEVNPSLRPDDGRTPLWIAAHTGDLPIVKLLLADDHDVSLEARTDPGSDPWEGQTAAEVARWSQTVTGKFTNDPNDDPKRREENCGVIADLVEEYQREELRVKLRLRKETCYGGMQLLNHPPKSTTLAIHQDESPWERHRDSSLRRAWCVEWWRGAQMGSEGALGRVLWRQHSPPPLKELMIK